MQSEAKHLLPSEVGASTQEIGYLNHGYLYIMSNNARTLYTGVTNTLERRVYEHKNKLVPGFTARYNIDRLVYYEYFDRITDAIAREKTVKGWSRAKKIALIESVNPGWLDLRIGEQRGWRALPGVEGFAPEHHPCDDKNTAQHSADTTILKDKPN
jgi:putative endonuclease